ncbi:MAG: FAD-binding protein [Proteobacteria bacterium]|nr:FAD-binding protein [Pseudomonadota bacterium]
MPDIGEILSRELGSDRVIRADSDRLADYGRDESSLEGFLPDCAVLCRSREEIAWVLRIAAERRVPVTPRGAGSGKTGGCLPVAGGIVLSTERMSELVDIDSRDLVAVAQPGVITGQLQSAVEDERLFYPPDPASLGVCSIGGNVATGAGGPRAFRYGVTRDYVLGLEVVLMGGEILRIGRRTAKGVTGYDLVAGFVGSEGTFGVITEIVVKLLPLPAGVSTLLAVFPTMEAASAAVDAIIHRGFWPRTLEIADRTAVDHVRPYSHYRFPTSTGAILLVELDGDPDGLQSAALRVGQLCEDAGAAEVVVAKGSADRRDLWQARRMISSSLRRAHRHKESEDICVPRGAIAEMIRRIDRLAARFDMPFATYGHAGDGNLHVNVLIDGDRDDPAVAERVEAALSALFRDTIELGGTLSGEHGIGLSKKRFMPLEQSARVLQWQRQWKRMWDPLELLNPGKVLPAQPAGCRE